MARRQAGLWAGVVLGVVFLGCQSTTAPVTTEPTIGKAFLSDGAEIGPQGGVLNVGNYTLTVPPGALSNTVYLSITQEGNGQWPVVLGPEGTQFTVPVTVAFDASSEANPASMSVAWWNPSTSQWVDQATMRQGSVLSTQASHFSKFIIH